MSIMEKRLLDPTTKQSFFLWHSADRLKHVISENLLFCFSRKQILYCKNI